MLPIDSSHSVLLYWYKLYLRFWMLLFSQQYHEVFRSTDGNTKYEREVVAVKNSNGPQQNPRIRNSVSLGGGTRTQKDTRKREISGSVFHGMCPAWAISLIASEI